MSACTCHPTSSDSVSHKRQLFAIISCLSHSNITHGFAACRATPPSPEPRPTRLSMTAHFEGHWHLQRDAKACGAILRIEALWRARSQLRASVAYRILHFLTLIRCSTGIPKVVQGCSKSKQIQRSPLIFNVLKGDWRWALDILYPGRPHSTSFFRFFVS